jgi:hypothetical protein
VGTDRTIDLRIGRRVRLTPMPIRLTWSAAGRWRRRTIAVDGYLIEVSVTGAQLLGPEKPALAPGTVVRVAAGMGVDASARVTRALVIEGYVLYGVEVVRSSSAYRAMVDARIGAGRGDTELAWRRAR